MKKSEDRLRVIENMKNSIKEGNFNNKVEENDHIVTLEDRQKVILNYDSKKKKLKNKMEYIIARNITDKITCQINKQTEIIGLENIKNITTGAIITSNHFSKVDNTIIRYMMQKINKTKDFGIIVQDTNFFMPGELGWLVRNNKTIPLSMDYKYMSRNFNPTIKELLEKKNFILIYPEEEMWFNYKKPRPLKPGAYHYATKYNVPIIPCFVKIDDLDEVGEDGFKKSKYTLYVMPPIYPDKNKNLRTNKEEMMKKDYDLKVKAYEMAYNKKMDDSFNEKEDIAGW